MRVEKHFIPLKTSSASGNFKSFSDTLILNISSNFGFKASLLLFVVHLVPLGFKITSTYGSLFPVKSMAGKSKASKIVNLRFSRCFKCWILNLSDPLLSETIFPFDERETSSGLCNSVDFLKETKNVWHMY